MQRVHPPHEFGALLPHRRPHLDEKIIAIPFEDPTYHLYTDISELPAHVASEIKHFFRVYKSLEGKETVVSDVLGRQAAVDIIIKCQDAYIEKYCK